MSRTDHEPPGFGEHFDQAQDALAGNTTVKQCSNSSKHAEHPHGKAGDRKWCEGKR